MRQLANYKRWLDPGSALHRAEQHEQQRWTNVEALLWLLSHQLDKLDARLVWQKRRRNGPMVKWPKFKQFPWSKSGEHYGDPGDSTEDERIAYLQSVGPGGDAR